VGYIHIAEVRVLTDSFWIAKYGLEKL